MPHRRSVVRAVWAGLVGSAVPAFAQQRRSRADPLRLGVDTALADSGFAKALLRGFGLDTGVAVKLVAGPAHAVLKSLEQGEFDAALTNSPQMEQDLETKGLVHERSWVATSDFVIVGPLVKPPGKGKLRSNSRCGASRNWRQRRPGT
jgi:tungstate transport system substrate-binding protein